MRRRLCVELSESEVLVLQIVSLSAENISECFGYV